VEVENVRDLDFDRLRKWVVVVTLVHR
jgi:hypothetical protein